VPARHHIATSHFVELSRAGATEGNAVNGTQLPHPDGADADAVLGALLSERRQLINVTYRLLGSLVDAEDVVQETLARWYAMSPEQQATIHSPGAWLTTVASRICLDLLGSARARRERYVGQWIPEPLPGGIEWINERSGDPMADPPDPADRVTLDESINMAFLVILESMTPAERVTFILHDVFGYAFTEVADVVGRSPAACRQLTVSARRRINVAEAVTAPKAQQADLVREFKQAWETKNIPAIIDLLDPDATSTADSGGQATLAYDAIDGAARIACAFAEIVSCRPDLRVLERTVNGQPGLVAQQHGAIVTVLAFDFAGDRIKHIWAIRNPDKLGQWTTD
jgi:RNA polymerase sigma-70 factor (ECF subfamily)